MRRIYYSFKKNQFISNLYKSLVPEPWRISIMRRYTGQLKMRALPVVIKGDLDVHKLSDAPKVAVIVTVFNDESYLEMCLQSVAIQDYPDLECIIVDDFSTDNSLNIAKKFSSKDSRFKVIAHRANGGLPAARNTGVMNSTADYVCFLDSDDFLYSHSISARVAPLVKLNDPRVIGTWCRWNPVPFYAEKVPESSPAENMSIIDFIQAAGDCPFIATSPLISRDKFIFSGGFDESFSQAEDWELWQRLLRMGYRFIPSDVFAVAYRQKKTSMIRSGVGKHFSISKQLLEEAYKPFPSQTDTVKYYKGWAYYSSLKTIAPRAISSLAMAVAQGQDTSHMIALYDRHDWNVIVGCVDLKECVKNALIRVNGLTGGDVGLQASWLERMCNERLNEILGMLPSQENKEVNKVIDEYDVIFLPHKNYHIVTIQGLITSLESRGLRVAVLDLTYAYRDEGVKKTAQEYGINLIPYNYYLLGNITARKVVCLNDWDTNIVKPIIENVNSMGGDTYGIVEGIQDFTDADTGRERKAYKTVKNVLLAGRYDEKFFDNRHQKLFCYGVPRLGALLNEKVEWPAEPLVVINMNFSYGVLTDCAEGWLESIVQACKKAGVKYVVSRHPADLTKIDECIVSTKSMYDLIREGTIFVSRFGSGILEALAMGKYAIYHNPHGERVIKFSDEGTPLLKTKSVGELTDAISQLCREAGSVDIREKYGDYLDEHCNIYALSDADDRAAEFICS